MSSFSSSENEDSEGDSEDVEGSRLCHSLFAYDSYRYLSPFPLFLNRLSSLFLFSVCLSPLGFQPFGSLMGVFVSPVIFRTGDHSTGRAFCSGLDGLD